MGRAHTLPLLLGIIALCQPSISARQRSRPGRFDECVLFKSNDTYAMRVSESYLDLGYYDIRVEREFELSFEVLPDRVNHDGPLFAIGTDQFNYYEWKTKAVKTQFFVVEFFYSAISMIMKALGTEHLYQMEIYRTHPEPYTLDDVRWHTVRAFREVPPDGRPQTWTLELDHLSTQRNITDVTNIHMLDSQAFLGGRPGYRSSQFRGIMRNLHINGERVALRGKATVGLIEVWHCSAPEVSKFVEELADQGGWRRPGSGGGAAGAGSGGQQGSRRNPTSTRRYNSQQQERNREANDANDAH